MDYRAAARQLAAEAEALAETILAGSDDLIDYRFAIVRAAYAKCKGAHAALLAEALGEKHADGRPEASRYDVAALASVTERIRRPEDLPDLVDAKPETV